MIGYNHLKGEDDCVLLSFTEWANDAMICRCPNSSLFSKANWNTTVWPSRLLMINSVSATVWFRAQQLLSNVLQAVKYSNNAFLFRHVPMVTAWKNFIQWLSATTVSLGHFRLNQVKKWTLIVMQTGKHGWHKSFYSLRYRGLMHTLEKATGGKLKFWLTAVLHTRQ